MTAIHKPLRTIVFSLCLEREFFLVVGAGIVLTRRVWL
jgi:hypothetical protein